MGVPPGSLSAAISVLEAASVRVVPVAVVPIAGKGRGVVAVRRIVRGELIESAPVVVVPAGQMTQIDGTVLKHYVYDWADGVAVALGNGSIYNHSYAPNAIYTRRFDAHALEYTALRDIEAGEEILINYNGDPDDRTPLWFTVV